MACLVVCVDEYVGRCLSGAMMVPAHGCCKRNGNDVVVEFAWHQQLASVTHRLVHSQNGTE